MVIPFWIAGVRSLPGRRDQVFLECFRFSAQLCNLSKVSKKGLELPGAVTREWRVGEEQAL